MNAGQRGTKYISNRENYERKKHVVDILAVCIAILICAGCAEQALPMPPFPLDELTLEYELERVGLNWTIKESETWGEGRMFYEMINKEGKGIATISSVGDGDVRVLQLSFFSSNIIDEQLPTEDWEGAIRLATGLYGGFESDNQVYRSLQETYAENTVIDTVPGDEFEKQKRIRWSDEISDVRCIIGFSSENEVTDLAKTKMVSIYFTNQNKNSVEK